MYFCICIYGLLYLLIIAPELKTSLQTKRHESSQPPHPPTFGRDFPPPTQKKFFFTPSLKHQQPVMKCMRLHILSVLAIENCLVRHYQLSPSFFFFLQVLHLSSTILSLVTVLTLIIFGTSLEVLPQCIWKDEATEKIHGAGRAFPDT